MYEYSVMKSELIQLKPAEFYMKYIVKSYNWYFEEYSNGENETVIEKIDTFKEIVTKNFEISFHSVQMVGSAKIGFSLSPYKGLREFVKQSLNDNDKVSDIDLAIVSDSLFDEIWRAMRKHKSTYYMSNYQRVANSVFLGYINDKDFTDMPNFNSEIETRINNTNRELIEELSIIHPISYRIYRSWEDLEEYQLTSIEKARSANCAI
ncbi:MULTISPECIES: hypothetical protein [Paenibacillus]|uniref:hypothetical protein n=1 Tax=Paenibacillus TaxID=44249 RepID=UPI001AE833F8|nr:MULTISPECIES: hypothetical protein [Paenibacillus]MBP1174665.1 hypothetical protein [Paenibacillus sp. PvR133]MDQ0049467.1 hypothetical protein [Paenibacillus polymyxa]URJ61111.1 hypothetical protein MF622_000795 [Paenibacillus polymyxa]